MKIFLVTAAFLGMLTTGAYADQPKCQDFESSVWVGDKKGKGYEGAITIEFKDKCKTRMSGNSTLNYVWVGSNGKVVTPGRLTFSKNGQIAYNNTAGSRGEVVLNSKNLVWVNTYTGKNYKVNVRRK